MPTPSGLLKILDKLDFIFHLLGREFPPSVHTRLLCRKVCKKRAIKSFSCTWRTSDLRVAGACLRLCVCTHLVLDVDEQLRDGAAHQNHQQHELAERSRGPHGCRWPRLDASVWTQSDLASAVMQTPSRTIIWSGFWSGIWTEWGVTMWMWVGEERRALPALCRGLR